MTAAFVPGFLLGLSLILVIGAQNAFVLRQGLRGEHVLAVCAVCAASDAILILAGVAGVAEITTAWPWLEPVMRYAGAAFLFAYGARSLVAAIRSAGALVPADTGTTDLNRTLATCLALTWLNPHVYLDTLVLIGSISNQYPGHQWVFAAGAVTASFVFFFTLGYGAVLLRPLFARPLTWRILDIAIALVMWAIAAGLLLA